MAVVEPGFHSRCDSLVAAGEASFDETVHVPQGAGPN